VNAGKKSVTDYAAVINTITAATCCSARGCKAQSHPIVIWCECHWWTAVPSAATFEKTLCHLHDITLIATTRDSEGAFSFAGCRSPHHSRHCLLYCQLHTNAFVCLDCIFDLHRQCQKHRIRCHLVVACHLECCLVSCQLKRLCRWTVLAYKCKRTTRWLYERPLFKWTVIVLFVRLNNSITVSQRFTYAQKVNNRMAC